MLEDTGPTVADVERIAGMDNPILRNLHITQCYYDLARAVETRLPGNACWCTFATWASKQAGQTIRKEDLIRALEHVLGSEQDAQEAAGDLAKAVGAIGSQLGANQMLPFLLKVLDPESAFARSSQAVARGNLKVFAEIGRAFAHFNAACLGDASYDGDNLAKFVGSLLPGEPPDGQRYLRQAFEHYYGAFFEDDPKTQAELTLLANLEIGFHEQTRLQPEINLALAAPIIPPDVFTKNLVRALRPGWGRFSDVVWSVLRFLGRLTDLDQSIGAYLAAARRQTQLLITESVMTIEFPEGRILRLGLDLEQPYPPELRQITISDLQAFLAQIDPVTGGTSGSGAKYWGELPDRMNFIGELFRCYQEDDLLSKPPFSVRQTATLKAGGLPDGRL